MQNSGMPFKDETMDWKKMLEELAAIGWSQTRIADHCGVGQMTVSDLARGETKNPGYSFGRKLEALHASVFPKGGLPAKLEAKAG